MIDRRPDARIVRSALDEVKVIQTLLSDAYKDAGDGRTLLRELVQNADDAGASKLVFAILDHGWPQAGNSLLRGPALLVANDGPFPVRDREALHHAVGGSKADDAGKVGRFGIGLKSVFHICEALVYIGAAEGIITPGALNPWAGTGDGGDADPLHPDWDRVEDEDVASLIRLATLLLGSFDRGLLQWAPLRRREHLDRAQDRPYGLGQVCPTPDQVAAWFSRPASLALLLAQCGHLRSIEAYRVPAPDELDARNELVRVSRPTFVRAGWVGRYDDDGLRPDRAFGGTIEAADRTWSVLGIEALGLNSLRTLRSADDWPLDQVWRDGRSVWIPRKALAHAAITVLRPDHVGAECCGARLRWAVFLPLDDDPNPRSSPVVETVGQGTDAAAWEIVMHGYFWPSHDRRSIPGVTNDDSGTGDDAVRSRWNRAVRDELLLPLLPSALANAVAGIPDDVARPLLEAVFASRMIADHSAAITRRHALLPVITHDEVNWSSSDTTGSLVVSIPNWTRAPRTVRKLFAESLSGTTDNILFIDGDAPRIGGRIAVWPPGWLARLLECISTDELRTTEQLSWIDGLVHHAIESQSAGHDERCGVVARWLAKRIGDGALPSGSDGASRDDLRTAWRGIIRALPAAWLVDAPIASQPAVSELASRGIVGEGLLPLPLGRRPESNRISCPNAERLDRALLELGNLLFAGHDGSAQRARLLLAETLLSVREDRPLGEELDKLPLLRAHKLPEERDEAWSVGQLRHHTERLRVFARVGDGVDSAALESPSDPKRAVQDLAEAVNDNVWIVDDMVAATAGAPAPTTADLAAAVLQTASILSPAAQRIGLLRRLGRDATNPVVRQAIRTLLTGRGFEPGDEPKLYYVRRQDRDRDANRNTLDILLHLLGKAWSAIEAEMVELLPHSVVEDLHVKAVDAGVLHQLLGECLDGITNWSRLDLPGVLHLLRHLYATAGDDRVRWRAMPLHRRAGGERGSLDDRALRAVGEMRLPPELESEIRVLDPDREVVNLYLDVPALDDDGVLRAMLMSRHPQQFADDIVRALRANGDGRVTLPRDARLLSLLRDASWLPHRDDGSGLAPRQLLVVPRELRSGIVPLASAGAIGEYRLSELVAPAVWSAAEAVVQEILGRPSRARQVQRLAGALNPAKVAEVDGGAYLLLPGAQRVSATLLEDAFQSPLAGSHSGWALVRAAANLLGPGSERQPHDVVLEIARSLCAPIPASRQVSVLTTVAATHPPKDSPSGRLFRCFLDSFAETLGFFDDVLPHLELPTQDGQWQPARLVARSASGVARRHRVLSDLRSVLRLDSDEPVRAEAADDIRIGAGTTDVLAAYFAPWAERLPHGAVGAFIAILGNGNNGALVHLAEEWLGDDVNVEGMRQGLISAGGRDPCSEIKVSVSGRVSRGKRVEAVNVLGERVEMDAGSDDDTVFATDPARRSSRLGNVWETFWEIGLRDVEPKQRTAHELVALLGGTVEWWAVRVLRLDQQRVRAWWSRWGTGSQAQVGPVQASILAHLPLTLDQLDVQECKALREALREAQRAQRRREQAPPERIREATDTEREALGSLASLIRDNREHQLFVWSRVQERMRRFGYRDDSVLLELAQNADDALSQAAEIARAPLPPTARRLVVRVHVQDGVTTIDVRHHGRPINDTGGAGFPAGRDRQWDQDLYFMMLLNLSGKPGETPGQAAVAATTGRFGLGFKSVHLVSATPCVASGFVGFSIAGGLLPFEQPVPDDPDLLPADGHRATRVRLPLRKDADESELLARMFRRFVHTRTLLPVFARQLREIVVDGGPCAGVSAFDPQPLDAAAGWSLAATTVEVSGQGHWRVLRFRPADTGEDTGTGTAALAVGLKDGKPAPFPADVPFLWNVTPTSEGWGCGYAVNGPFKLDPGRTHVSLDDDVTCRVVDLLGKALGGGLVELHDSLLRGPHGALVGLPAKDDVHVFLATLWKVLASGIDTRDELRRAILLRLHGPERGLSVWMGACAVVPSDLPRPFLERLPALKRGVRVEVAGDGLDNPTLCRAFDEIADLASLAEKHPVVSANVAERLRPLLNQALRKLDASDLLAELAERWDHVLTPDRLHALRPLAADLIWRAIQNGAWHAKLVARAADGTPAPLRELLLPRDVGMEHVDADVADELLRAAFAPDRTTLAATYIVQAEDLALFLRLRVRHQIDARTIAAWYATLTADRRPAALTYLLHGKLQHEVLQCLIGPEDRPDWLGDYDDVRSLLEELGEDRWRSQGLLAALFPDRFQGEPGPLGPPLLPESTKRSFFERLDEWWNDAKVRLTVIESYEAKAWPDWLRRDGIAEGLKSGSRDHWLGLLVLGACRSLGRAEAGHHRSFLESAHSEGWWDVFKTPEDVAAWMNVLRTWQDKAAASLTYPRWMSLFPAIYQLSRYLEKYRRLLTSAAQRPAELYQVTCLLAPRVDEALTGAGQQFDAPPAPLNMGLHWVLRELVRVGVLDGNHIFPDCWVPSDRVLRFLQPLGLEAPDGTNSDKAHAIFGFLVSELNTPSPHLHRAFDIPLRHIDSNSDLRRRFGLKEE